MAMKLSDLDPKDITLMKSAPKPAGDSSGAPAPLKLSDIDQGDIKLLARGTRPDFNPAIDEDNRPSLYDSIQAGNFHAPRLPTDDELAQAKEVADSGDATLQARRANATTGDKLKAILFGTGPAADPRIVQGDVPMALPGGAIPRLTKAATALAEGQGLGYAAARTGISAGQGAVMSAAMGGNPGESMQDKLDRAGDGALLSGGIQAAAEAVPYVGKGLGKLASKVGEMLTGENSKLIKNYADRTDEVNKIIEQSGGDMTAAADQIRTELSNGIQKTKRAINGQISSALESAPTAKTISVQPMIESLESAKAGLNPNFKANAISEIDEMIGNLKKESGEDGMINPQSLYEIKQYLGGNAKGAYTKGGQIFNLAGESARAAKDAASEARDLIAEHVPEISQADSQLSKLHGIEGRLNKNLLAPGKPDAAIMAAGSGANPRNAATLRELEKLSGVPVMQRTQDLATARAFANPTLMPVDSTGKALARIAAGAGIGGALGETTGEGDHGSMGAVIGGTLASPMALKGLINAANVVSRVGAKTGLPGAAQFVRQNPLVAQGIAQLAAKQVRDANAPTQQRPSSAPPVLGDNPNGDRVPSSQPKGMDKFALDGATKLGLDRATAAAAMQSPQLRQLLMQAHDLPAGHPSLKKIQTQLQKGMN